MAASVQGNDEVVAKETRNALKHRSPGVRHISVPAKIISYSPEAPTIADELPFFKFDSAMPSRSDKVGQGFAELYLVAVTKPIRRRSWGENRLRYLLGFSG